MSRIICEGESFAGFMTDCSSLSILTPYVVDAIEASTFKQKSCHAQNITNKIICLFQQLDFLKADFSTVIPNEEIINETFLEEKIKNIQEQVFEDLYEDDSFFQMPPLGKFILKVRIKSIEEFEPSIANAEGINNDGVSLV